MIIKRSFIKNILLLVIITWVAHFFYFKNFGFYEDDYVNIPPYLDVNLSELMSYIWSRCVYWFQGRPFIFLPAVYTYIGVNLGGLYAIYILAYVILLVNSILFYLLLRKIYPETEEFALIGALLFCLFPPDTSKILLIHSFVLQNSLMFLLIASILYFKHWRKLSYIVILGALFSYETVFMIFYGIPLLKPYWHGKFKKEFFTHIIILTVIIFVYVLIRNYMGDYGIGKMRGDLLGTFLKIGAAILIGPVMNLYLFMRAPAVTILNLDITTMMISMICFAVFFLYFYRYKIHINKISQPISAKLKFFEIKGEIITQPSFLRIFKIFLISVIFLSLAYSLSFTHYPPTVVKGRLTSVHLAATFGGSILFTCLIFGLLNIANYYKLKIYFVIIFSLYLSFLVGYRVLIQKDFVKSWYNQKFFWSKVIELCPDLNNNTLIIVLENDNIKLPQTSYIVSNSWSDPVVLGYIYRFPPNWENPPRLFVVNFDFEKRILIEKNQLKWKVPIATWWSHWEVLSDSNIIFLTADNEDKKLKRIDSSFVTIHGKKLYLKPKQLDSLPYLEKGVLYDFMIKPNL